MKRVIRSTNQGNTHRRDSNDTRYVIGFSYCYSMMVAFD